MPKSTEEILAHADVLAKGFEDYEPSELELQFADQLADIHRWVVNRATAEKNIVDAIRSARKAGAPWDVIGSILGTSGEAARQKYRSIAA